MKKYLILAVSVLALTGAAFATQTLPVAPTKTVTKPLVRPALKKLLDKRPVVPVKKPAPAMTGNVKTSTGIKLPVPTTGQVVKTGTVIKAIVQQNAEDVKAYREENGYVVRYLKTPTREEKLAFGEAVIKAIKDFLAAQKNMNKAYDDGVKAGTPMPKTLWDNQAEIAVAAYKTAVQPYIDSTKTAEFEAFLIIRLKLLKLMFDKKNKYADMSDSSSSIDMRK